MTMPDYGTHPIKGNPDGPAALIPARYGAYEYFAGTSPYTLSAAPRLTGLSGS